MKLTDKQKGVIRGVVPAALLTVAGLCGVSLLIPVSALPIDEPGARIAWALQWSLLPILMLMISIMGVANYRFFSPEDIDGSGLTDATPRVGVLRAILQNTLEQAALAVAAYLIWAAIMPVKWLRAIPMAALLFVSGRILFARGYERGAPGRAIGFGLTAYPTFGMLTIAAVALLFRLIRWADG
ncbi:MAG: MAPEG family protein [Burkholderiales bacterium]